MVVEEASQKVAIFSRERLLVDQDETDAPPFRFFGRVEQGACQIGRAQGVVSQLSELGPKQGTVPLIRHHQEHSWRESIIGGLALRLVGRHALRVAHP